MRNMFPGVVRRVALAAVMLAGALVPWPAEAQSARHVYLIRHGKYDQSDERAADVGKALVPMGVAQAKLLGARLRALPVTISSLSSSTFTRARQTAEILQAEFPERNLRQSELLCECTPPTWRKDVMARVERADAQDCVAQLELAFAELFVPSPGEPEHDIVVCHGNVIRYFVTRVLKVNSQSWLGMSIGHCSVTVVRVNRDGQLRLLSFGDVGHLPPSMQSGTMRESPSLAVPGVGGVPPRYAEKDGVSVQVLVPPGEARSIGTYQAFVQLAGGSSERLVEERDGAVEAVWLEDLAGDAAPELIIVTVSAGSGSYGTVQVWELTEAGARERVIAALTEEQSVGYQGHDRFEVVDGRLRRRFPAYAPGDNAAPSKGFVRLEYSFEEARWDPVSDL